MMYMPVKEGNNLSLKNKINEQIFQISLQFELY
jgi:hypothetical protein